GSTSCHVISTDASRASVVIARCSIEGSSARRAVTFFVRTGSPILIMTLLGKAVPRDDIRLVLEPQRAVLLEHFAGRIEIASVRHRGPQSLVFDLRDRKSTRLNSSHRTISYAVFC